MAVELYDEHEQGERVRRWLQANGLSIIIALVLALGGVFGFQQYQLNQLSNQSAAASYFNSIQDLIDSNQLEMAEDYFAELEALNQDGFYVLAAMTMAQAYVDAGRLGPATALYETLWTMRGHASLKGLIGLRLARLLSGQGDVQGALEIIGGEPPVGYAGPWAEARGDIYFDAGDIDSAREAYREALDGPDDMGFGTSALQMKYDATGPGAVEGGL